MNFSEYEKLAVSLRREFHKIPELGGEEYKTCELIYNTLLSYKIENTKKLFSTGVTACIGDINNPCIAFRADIDGLLVAEKTHLPFESINKGKMHACGHDGHIAVLLSFAKLLKDNENKLKNCVKLIFQPAEETDGGAMGMINEGVLDNPKVEKIFGFHFWPEVLSGKVMYSSGASFSECERYEIHITGNGGHGAMPEGIKNCLYAVSDIIKDIKNISENHPESVLSACSVNSTGYHNIFADKAVIKGTIRTVKQGEREKIEDEIKKACEKSLYGCKVEPVFVYEYPGAVNHQSELSEIVEASKKVIGEENVYEGKCTFAAEDFAFFTTHTKGAHIKIGTKNMDNPLTLNPLHSPEFSIDEDTLKIPLKIFWEIVKKSSI